MSTFSKQNLSGTTSLTGCSTENSSDFLTNMIPAPNTEGELVSIQQENPLQHQLDAGSMTATQLKEKYQLTYNTWKNMKQRCKKPGSILDQRFEQFSDFLWHMGPRKHQKFTLDRIDYKNPIYSPEHCQWATKQTQNQNKGNNVLLTHEGETFTVAEWAYKTGKKADTLYKRKAKGWSDEEVITGQRKPAGLRVIRVVRLEWDELQAYLLSVRMSLAIIQRNYEADYDEHGPDCIPNPVLVAKYNEAQKNFFVLNDEINRRAKLKSCI